MAPAAAVAGLQRAADPPSSTGSARAWLAERGAVLRGGGRAAPAGWMASVVGVGRRLRALAAHHSAPRRRRCKTGSAGTAKVRATAALRFLPPSPAARSLAGCTGNTDTHRAAPRQTGAQRPPPPSRPPPTAHCPPPTAAGSPCPPRRRSPQCAPMPQAFFAPWAARDWTGPGADAACRREIRAAHTLSGEWLGALALPRVDRRCRVGCDRCRQAVTAKPKCGAERCALSGLQERALASRASSRALIKHPAPRLAGRARLADAGGRGRGRARPMAN